jgi:hypothetical protein
MMLYKLADHQSSQSRPSDLTYVESGSPPKTASRFHEEQSSIGTDGRPASRSGKRITHAEDHRIAGLPKAELGPKV